eukprot:66270-Heterocapsa_arctica.AAC.1
MDQHDIPILDRILLKMVIHDDVPEESPPMESPNRVTSPAPRTPCTRRHSASHPPTSSNGVGATTGNEELLAILDHE